MNSIYTTTITNEAKRRGIKIEVLDERLPIFILKKGHKSVRCFNVLTDNVGAASFILAQNKSAANSFLRKHGVPVPDQVPFNNMDQARLFLKKHKCIVVKPAAQWGGRGISVAVRTAAELHHALQRARRCEEDILLEQFIDGDDYRLIFVNYKFVAAIKRSPAVITGDGKSTILTLIRRFNRIEQKIDPSHRIPFDRETERTLACSGMNYRSVPADGMIIPVRRNSNYHTGGVVEVVTDNVDRLLVSAALKIARLVAVPVIAIDFLYNKSAKKYWVIELSPDLAVSPPEGGEVAKRFLDYLFPVVRINEKR
ncbi:MAG: ATP-grasp domain-containing protein [Kiritimatiellae bacterium]|nr:ATP-grasp domain-containing protein [Kiritimatiellia bacterium]MDD5521132.1 ATP-grasp domain-containing protein [Kiritimatiellia bacterium]